MTNGWTILLTTLICSCGGAMPDIGDSVQLRAHAQTTLDSIVEETGSPGISYQVVTADEIVFEGTSGSTDSAHPSPVTPKTMFMACSTTKVLTAIAVMRLVERGAMSLDAPLSSYFEEHPYGDGVTIRMLLAHTGGVPNPMPVDWFAVEGEPMDRSAAFAKVLGKADELADDPGTTYRYSNVGYWLLGAAIEKASGVPYERFVEEEILSPLGIADDASFDLPPPSRYATGHSRIWSFETPIFRLMTPSRYWSTMAGGWVRFERLLHHGPAYGGLYVTPSAFGAILSDLLKPEGVLLTAGSKEALFAPQQLADGSAIGGTLGWVTGEVDGARYLGKQGGAIGFQGNVRLYPDLGIATVYFANATAVSTGPIDARSDRLDAAFVRFYGVR